MAEVDFGEFFIPLRNKRMCHVSHTCLVYSTDAPGGELRKPTFSMQHTPQPLQGDNQKNRRQSSNRIWAS